MWAPRKDLFHASKTLLFFEIIFYKQAASFVARSTEGKSFLWMLLLFFYFCMSPSLWWMIWLPPIIPYFRRSVWPLRRRRKSAHLGHPSVIWHSGQFPCPCSTWTRRRETRSYTFSNRLLSATTKTHMLFFFFLHRCSVHDLRSRLRSDVFLRHLLRAAARFLWLLLCGVFCAVNTQSLGVPQACCGRHAEIKWSGERTDLFERRRHDMLDLGAFEMF